MSNYLNKIVYLTDEQYTSLINTGSITKNGTTYHYDQNTLYITDTDLATISPSTQGTATEFITSISQDKYGKISATKASLNTSGTWSGTATTATTATNLSAKPSLAANGNNITVTAGGKTSDTFTVPYATSAGSATTATSLTNFVISTYTIAAGKGVRIQYPTQAPVLISAQRSNSSGRLILLGGGYGAEATVRNDFTEVVSSGTNIFTWSLPESASISNSLEIMNLQTTGTADVIVWSKSACTFTEITALTSNATNRKLLHSSNYTDYTVSKTGTGASGSWGISITGSSASCTGNAATATAIETAGTTAQFYRGDNSWSNIIKQTDNAALGIGTNLKIGTAIKDLHFTVESGSGTGINDGNAGGITIGTDTASYGGIYWQSSGSYGLRLHFATTGSFANGAYTRMLITHDGKVGIGTLNPDTLLTVNGNAKATKFIGALEGNATSASKISAKLAATTKTYLLGTATAITATAANVEITGDTGVYLTTTAGELSAVRHSWNVSGTEKAYTVYNTTDDSIDFVFI